MLAGSYDLFLKLYGARGPVKTGLEFAGIVEEASERYRKGERIFGYTNLMKGPKTHQQILNVKEECTAAIPDGLSFEQAASIAIAGNSSLVLIEDIARLSAGQSVLINGASGGVGVFALQYAKHRGLRVSATAGPGQQDFLKGLGAYEVYDYTRQPPRYAWGRFRRHSGLFEPAEVPPRPGFAVTKGHLRSSRPAEEPRRYRGQFAAQSEDGIFSRGRGQRRQAFPGGCAGCRGKHQG
jgi:hypothetical protein